MKSKVFSGISIGLLRLYHEKPQIGISWTWQRILLKTSACAQVDTLTQSLTLANKNQKHFTVHITFVPTTVRIVGKQLSKQLATAGTMFICVEPSLPESKSAKKSRLTWQLFAERHSCKAKEQPTITKVLKSNFGNLQLTCDFTKTVPNRWLPFLVCRCSWLSQSHWFMVSTRTYLFNFKGLGPMTGRSKVSFTHVNPGHCPPSSPADLFSWPCSVHDSWLDCKKAQPGSVGSWNRGRVLPLL